MRSLVTSIALLALLGGCRGGEALLEANGGMSVASKQAYNTALGARSGKGERQSERNGRGRKGKTDAGVYVDGAYVGALRYNELPASLPITWLTMQDGSKSQRYSIADYLAAIGVDLEKVRALHLHGGRARVTMIDGDELRRTASRLHISFTRGTGGDPQFRYPGVDLDTNTAVDKIGAVAVYLDKTPPEKKFGQLMIDGQVVTGMAYADEAPRGTRVYLDGRFLGAVQRRDLDESSALQDGRYSLGRYLATLGVASNKVRQVQVVARDKVALESDGTRLGKDDITFDVPEHSRGRIHVDGVAKDATVDAIVLYSTSSTLVHSGKSRS